MDQPYRIRHAALSDILVGNRTTMLRTLRIALCLFLAWAFITQDRLTEIFWLGLAVCLLSFFPSYLYCRKPTLGLPIFPLFALTHLWAFGFPLLSNEARLAQYPIAYVEAASVTVSAYLLVGTLAYLIVGRRPTRRPREILVIRQSFDSWLWVPLLMAFGFSITSFFGIGDRFGPLFPVIQAAMLAVQALAIFVLAFRYGNNDMNGIEKVTFVVLLGAMILIQASSLLLVGAMTIFLIATVAFSIGRGRLPWFAIALCLTFFAMLHAGKSKMRARYWSDDAERISITQLPDYFQEWLGYSFENGIGGLFKMSEKDEGESQSILQRSSLLHLLVYEQAVCPDSIPYLDGATYAIVPQLLVPRFMNAEKIWSHQGTYMLNIHFGIQTSDQTLTTTIGWGLLNEAFANFGLLGIGVLALLIGSGYAVIERATAVASLLSLRVFIGILVLTGAFQTEYSAGVFVSSIFQGVCALLAMSFLLMERQRLRSNEEDAAPLSGLSAHRAPA